MKERMDSGLEGYRKEGSGQEGWYKDCVQEGCWTGEVGCRTDEMQHR